MPTYRILQADDDGAWADLPGLGPYESLHDAKHHAEAHHEQTQIRTAVLDSRPMIVWCSDSLHENFTQADDWTPVEE